MHEIRPFAFAVVVGVLAFGCSPASVSGGSDSDAGDGGSADKACTDSAFTRCSRIETCSPTAVQIRYGSESACQADIKAYCLANVAAGASTASIEACVQALPGWSCDDYLDTSNPPPACAQPTGSVATGGACAFPSQCQTGFCAIVPGHACGACAAAPKAGDSCANLTTCGMSLVCEPTTTTCASFGAQGAACGASQPCAAGLACAGATTTTMGTCAPSVKVAQAACMTTGAGCDVLSGLSCNSTSMTCQPLQLASGGQPCGHVNNQYAACSNGATCVGAMGATPGTCAMIAAVGGACDLANGPECPTLSRCIVPSGSGTSGTCQVPSATACK